MNVSGISTQSQHYSSPVIDFNSGIQSTYSASHRGTTQWQNAFIPQTSSWEGKPMCIDEFDENQNCCVTGYDISDVFEQAYEDGLEEHPGVKALESQPCVSAFDLETLVDNLIALAPEEPKRPKSSHIPGAPKELDLYEDVETVGSKVINYCQELLQSVMYNSFGSKPTVPQRAKLLDNFDRVRGYCTNVVFEHFNDVDVITNRFRR